MSTSKSKYLILIELNEINFDIVNRYISKYPGRYPFLEPLIKLNSIRTLSEVKYDQIEPWIQWVSVHTGLKFHEHNVYRLGDIVGTNNIQIFEKLEKLGLSVGAISPMNAENRLKSSAYFLPDPWTNTPTDSSWWSKSLGNAISQAVNDNSQSKITLKSVFLLIVGLLRFANPKHYLVYLKLVFGSNKSRWRKALFLDLFLHDLHLKLFRNRRPNFSTLFLNAGAHIQHHYLFNSEVKNEIELKNPDWYLSNLVDPFSEMLFIYNILLGEYLSLPNVDLIIATGLSQKPYDIVKYYWRLNDHNNFLNILGISYRYVFPRMTRDFLIVFDTDNDSVLAYELLSQIKFKSNGERLFGKIDNRGKSLFVTLTYPHNINKSDFVQIGDKFFEIYNHVSFVALKNGMHQGEGFAFCTAGVDQCLPPNKSHVSELHNSILKYFE